VLSGRSLDLVHKNFLSVQCSIDLVMLRSCNVFFVNRKKKPRSYDCFFFFAMSNKISIYMIFDVLLAIFAGPERDGLFH
jgi:hypothetical protein